MKSNTRYLCSLAGLLFLAACGGDSIDETVKPKVPEGLWTAVSVTQAPDGASIVDTALVSSAGTTGGGTAWFVFTNGTAPTGIARLPFSVSTLNENELSVKGTGSYLKLGTETVRQTIDLTGNSSLANALNGSIKVGTATPFSLSLLSSTGNKTAPKASDVVGTWSGSVGSKSATATWTIDSVGTLTGSSTTGCSYSGTIKPNAGSVAVLDVAVSENCPGAITTLNGISTLNAAKSTLAVAYTTANDAEGGLLQLTKK